MSSMKHLKSTLCALAALLLPALAGAQESLPFQPTPSGSKAGPTLAQSVYSPSKAVSHLPANAPNILIIMLDDVGPALPDTYGGPIHTSTLDRIANSGISYNSFHNSATSSNISAYATIHSSSMCSDNGSSSEGQNGTISELLAQNSIATNIKDHIRALNEFGGLDVLGSDKTNNMYHAGWAWAGSTPFQGTKLNASHFGGTRTPMAVSWPKSIQADKTPRIPYVNMFQRGSVE